MTSLILPNSRDNTTDACQSPVKSATAGSDQDRAETHPGPIDWLAVTRGMARGDSDCFQAFYDSHFDLMFREARRLLGRDENTCLDVVQDALLKTMRSIRPIASQGQLQQWTRLVVRTTALDWLRRKKRRREQATGSPDEVAIRADEDDQQLDRARMAWIEEQLSATEPEIRQLLSLRYRLGWTLREIAGHLGMKTGAVDGRIRRAVEELKKQAQVNDEL